MRLTVILGILLVTLLTVIEVSAKQPSVSHHSESKHSASAGGDANKGKKYHSVKHVKDSLSQSKHDVERAKKGESLKEKHKQDEEEKKGKSTKHHTATGHESFSKNSGESSHGAKFQEGARHKKLNYKKGFREQYHKNEEKKHDSFYSTHHKSGDFKVFGNKNQKYNKHHAVKHQGQNHKTTKTQDELSRSGKKQDGHNVEEKKTHRFENGAKSHHENRAKWDKTNTKGGKKQLRHEIPKRR